MPSNAKNILSAVNLNRGSNQFKIHDESQQAKLQAIISAIRRYRRGQGHRIKINYRSLVSPTQALKIRNNMQQLSLFKKVDAPPVQYIPSFLSKEDADLLLLHCLDLEWQQNQIKMLGKLMQVPRLETIYGDEGCDYLYSKSVHLTPIPWTTALDSLRYDIEKITGFRFNIVIGNLYRDGRDSIGWHSDAEKSMGLRPAITSLSLGAERKFQLRSNDKKQSYSYWLLHGSLLVMQPGCQSTWKHQVPKTSSLIGRRVNLTFRPHVKGKKEK